MQSVFIEFEWRANRTTLFWGFTDVIETNKRKIETPLFKSTGNNFIKQNQAIKITIAYSLTYIDEKPKSKINNACVFLF